MGDLQPISLSKGTNRGRYDVEASSRLINCYLEQLTPDGKTEFALYAINGWEAWATLPGASGGIRAMLSLDTELLVVAGRQLYSVAQNGASTLVGGIASDGLVTMARNRRKPDPQVVIVCDGAWYIYEAGALTIGSDPDLQAPIYARGKDGYFIFLSRDGTFTISGVDETTIDGLDFLNAQSNADGGVASATRGTELIIFGEKSTEFYVNTGNADFPFERQAYRGFGCYSAGSVAEVNAQINGAMVDSVIWAATDEKGAFTGLFMLSGYEAQKVSNHTIDRAIEDDAAPADIRSMAWSENGHVFYSVTGTGYSHVFDTSTGQWHERKSSQRSNWRAVAHESFASLALFGDADTGTIYKSSRNLYDAAGVALTMEVQLPLTHAWPYELIVNCLAVDAATGVGAVSTDAHDADPQIMLDWSRDGGANFGPVLSRSMGGAAQVNKRMEWRGLGRISQRGTVFRLRISAGVRKCIMAAAIDVDRLAA